jgi:ankyrin repeat protein
MAMTNLTSSLISIITIQINKAPLHIACEKGNHDMVQILLQAGADMEAKNIVSY